MNDMIMDGNRIKSVLGFGGLFKNAATQTTPFDVGAFVTNSSNFMRSNAFFYVPYGVGYYDTPADIAEYLGLVFKVTNHDLWRASFAVDPAKKAALKVSTDGRSWTSGGTFTGSYFHGQLPYNHKYVEQKFNFSGCETKMAGGEIGPTDGIRDWAELYVQTVDRSDLWGIEDMCRYHEKYCIPNGAQQYFAAGGLSSEQVCRNYMASLPAHSAACGHDRPLGGLSRACKFKHHFMIPSDPKLHCAHMGYGFDGTHVGAIDPKGNFKCDDVTECGAPRPASGYGYHANRVMNPLYAAKETVALRTEVKDSQGNHISGWYPMAPNYMTEGTRVLTPAEAAEVPAKVVNEYNINQIINIFTSQNASYSYTNFQSEPQVSPAMNGYEEYGKMTTYP